MNPFRIWREEREKDREVIREGIATLKSAFDAQAEQAKVLQKYLSMFDSPAQPIVREWDEEESIKRYLESRAESNGVPVELAGLSQLEAFDKLLERLDS